MLRVVVAMEDGTVLEDTILECPECAGELENKSPRGYKIKAVCKKCGASFDLQDLGLDL